MNQLLLAAMLFSATSDVPDGSVLILKDSNKPVSAFTGSNMTHVAVVVRHAHQRWVYEATPDQVRNVPLATYLQEVAKLNARRKQPTKVLLLEPRQAYSPEEIARMSQYMQSQLGRRYSVKGYVRDQQGDGIHCAEFAASALSCTNRFAFAKQPFAISPAEFYALIRDDHRPLMSVKLPAAREESTWCWRAWRDCLGTYAWCRWACYETWTFCR